MQPGLPHSWRKTFVFTKQMLIFASSLKVYKLMKTTISRDALFDFLQSLKLSAENKAWLGEKLIESAHEEASMPGQMDVREAKEWLKASELRFDNGEYVSEEAMEEYYDSLR